MVVIRSCFVFCLLSFLSSFGQTLNSDTNAISRTSQILLEKKIDFSWQGGSLDQVLEQLHLKYGFKFSHAGQQISFTNIKANSFKEVSLGYVLEALLKNTNFDYLLVGRMVVIVKRKSQNKEAVIKDSSKTIALGNNSIEKTAKSHVYSSNNDLEGLSWYEKRVIYKTFKKELHWQQRRQASSGEGNDSSATQKTSAKATNHIYKHFLEASVGIQKPLLSHKDNTNLDWESEMGFEQKAKTTLNADMGMGWTLGRFLLSTGLGYRRISTETNWTERRRSENRTASERCDILTVPLKAMVYKQWGNVFGAAGMAFKFNFIKLDFLYVNKFRRYYEDNSVASEYFQKTNKLCLSSAFLITGGMVWKQRYVFTATGSYDPYWSALENNSIYKLYPHQLSLNLGLIYLLDLRTK